MPKKYQIIDRHGHVVERDEVEDDTVPLRDGERLRVSMIAMDAATPLQRAIAENSRKTGTDKLFAEMPDALRRKVTERDPQGRLKATYEEDPDEDERGGKDHAMINDADAVFITDASGARFVLADALGRTDRASLARDNGFRFLLPVGDRAEGAMAVQRMQRDEARRELHDRMSNAWRGGAAPPSDAQPTFDAVEGARRKQKAYEAMCHDQANAWRSGK